MAATLQAKGHPSHPSDTGQVSGRLRHSCGSDSEGRGGWAGWLGQPGRLFRPVALEDGGRIPRRDAGCPASPASGPHGHGHAARATPAADPWPVSGQCSEGSGRGAGRTGVSGPEGKGVGSSPWRSPREGVGAWCCAVAVPREQDPRREAGQVGEAQAWRRSAAPPATGMAQVGVGVFVRPQCPPLDLLSRGVNSTGAGRGQSRCTHLNPCPSPSLAGAGQRSHPGQGPWASLAPPQTRPGRLEPNGTALGPDTGAERRGATRRGGGDRTA